LNLEEVWILRQAHCGIKDLAGFFTGWNAGNNGAEEGGVTELNYWGSHVITHRGDCFIVECTKCLISIFRVSNLSIGCIQASIRQSFFNQLVISSKALLTALFFTVYLVAQDGVKLINLGGFFGCNLGKDARWSPCCLHHVRVASSKSRPSLRTESDIGTNSTLMSRTFSASLIQREVAQANGQVTSNQNFTD